MGSFSNGEMWRIFEDKFCERCVHHTYDDGTDTWGCPVSDAHLMNDPHGNEMAEFILELLIESGVTGNTCKMFIEKPL